MSCASGPVEMRLRPVDVVAHGPVELCLPGPVEL